MQSARPVVLDNFSNNVRIIHITQRYWEIKHI